MWVSERRFDMRVATILVDVLDLACETAVPYIKN